MRSPKTPTHATSLFDRFEIVSRVRYGDVLMKVASSQSNETGTLEVRQAASVSALADRRWRDRPPLASRYALLRRLLACADLIAALIASVSLVVVGDGGTGQLLWSIAFLPVWILVGKLLGLYDRDESSLRHLTVDELPQIALWSLVCTSGLSLFLELTPAGRPQASSAIITGLVAAVLAVPLRAFVRWGWRRSTPNDRVAIIGASANAQAFKRKLELFWDLHMTVVEEREEFDLKENGRPWLKNIDRLVMTPDTLDDPRVAESLAPLRADGVLVTVVPPPGLIFGPAAISTTLRSSRSCSTASGISRDRRSY